MLLGIQTTNAREDILIWNKERNQAFYVGSAIIPVVQLCLSCPQFMFEQPPHYTANTPLNLYITLTNKLQSHNQTPLFTSSTSKLNSPQNMLALDPTSSNSNPSCAPQLAHTKPHTHTNQAHRTTYPSIWKDSDNRHQNVIKQIPNKMRKHWPLILRKRK